MRGAGHSDPRARHNRSRARLSTLRAVHVIGQAFNFASVGGRTFSPSGAEIAEFLSAGQRTGALGASFWVWQEATPEEWRQILDVNVVGPALVAKHVVPHMRRAGGGAIVNLSSISSFIAQPHFVTYNATKAAVAEGAIPVKYKELIAVAVALTTQCPYCIDIHSNNARKAGATEAELTEAAMVSAALRAGAAITHATHALTS